VSLHLIKLAVGVEDVDHFLDLQARRLAREGRLVHRTRQTPRRAAEVLDGGSLYWVIKGVVRVRQRLVGIETRPNDDGIPHCHLVRDPVVVRTCPQPRRPFQGWRYLLPMDAPPDLPAGQAADQEPPAEMLAELKELGLI
jgi:hypothetical protein